MTQLLEDKFNIKANEKKNVRAYLKKIAKEQNQESNLIDTQAR